MDKKTAKRALVFCNEQLIEKQTFKGRWPFTVEEGLLKYNNVGQAKALSFNPLQGITYALNDMAKVHSNDKEFGWQMFSAENI